METQGGGQAVAGSTVSTDTRPLTLEINRAKLTPTGLLEQLKAAGSTTGTIIGGDGEAYYWAYDAPANGKIAHYIWGAPVSNLPTSGTATYGFYGGTVPTDNLGRTGQLSANWISVNFNSQTLSAVNSPAVTLTFTGNTQVATTSYEISLNNVPINSAVQNLGTSCVTGCTSTAASGQGRFSFAGSNGQAVLGSLAVSGTVNVTQTSTTVSPPTAAPPNPTVFQQQHSAGAALIWTKP